VAAAQVHLEVATFGWSVPRRLIGLVLLVGCCNVSNDVRSWVSPVPTNVFSGSQPGSVRGLAPSKGTRGLAFTPPLHRLHCGVGVSDVAAVHVLARLWAL
jgi:hypothetical protein